MDLSAPAPALKAYAAERWIRAVTGVLDCPTDPKTIRAWGHAVGASAGALRAWCRAAGAKPKASLDFARLLRAIAHSRGTSWHLQNLLDIVDQRTVRHLLDRAGLYDVDPVGRPPGLDEFLHQQRLVSLELALYAIEALLAPLPRAHE